MMFVNNLDGTLSIARPEYFKAFIREALSHQAQEHAEMVRELICLFKEAPMDREFTLKAFDALASRILNGDKK